MATSKTLNLAIILFVVILCLLRPPISSAFRVDDDDDDWDAFEELMAIDEEEEREGAASGGKPSEAEILRRAQKIVLDLGNDNAKKVVDSNELVLLLGYTPWSKKSAQLMPRFAEAATELREIASNLVVAKLDCERHEKASTVLNIKGFPQVLLYMNGSALRYAGGPTKEEIVVWVRKKIGMPVIRLSSAADAKEILGRNIVFAVGQFETYEGIEYDEFVKAAASDDEVQFVETNDSSVTTIVFPDVPVKGKFLGLVKSEPDRFEKFEGNFEEEQILQFVLLNKYPLVTLMTEANSAQVWGSAIKLQVFVFADADDFKHLRNMLELVARNYKTKIMFVYADYDEEELAKPILSLYGIDEPEDPVVTAFDNRIGSKHLLESDITSSNLEVFCSTLLDGTLARYYKSESKPKQQKGLIEKVVGKTFDDSVLNRAENVFLEVHAPYCVDCEDISKKIEKLAEHFEGIGYIKFVRLDASLNEHPQLQITNYPTLVFYPAGNKSKPIKVSKKLSLDDLIAFIEDKINPSKEDVGKGEMNKDEL